LDKITFSVCFIGENLPKSGIQNQIFKKKKNQGGVGKGWGKRFWRFLVARSEKEKRTKFTIFIYSAFIVELKHIKRLLKNCTLYV
jgi:hypothetical protein